MSENVIYDISPARTGTTSLCNAMKILGYRASHGVPRGQENTTLNHLEYGYLDMPWAKDYDFIGGMFNYSWHRLVEQQPEAKFILLTRDLDDWIDSTIVKLREFSPKPGTVSYFHRIANLGCVHTSDRKRLAHYYRTHSQAIQDHFWGKDHQFLKMDIKDGWAPLCKFLGVDVPDTSFPHLNKGNPL